MDIKTISFSYWIPIFLSPLISVLSIFISNWLGRKSESRRYRLDMIDKSYQSYYIPLIKFLISANEENLTYYWLIASWYNAPQPVRKTTDALNVLVSKNLEFLPPKIVSLVPKYKVATLGAQLFFGEEEYRENYRHNLIEASDLFDEIIEISLKEADLISSKLGYPNIAKPILESFEMMEKTTSNHPRYLPEIYQRNSPRSFVGKEPPYI